MTDQLTFQVANDFDQVRLAKERVDAFSKRNKLPTDVAFAVKLAIEEVLTNTMSYGYSDNEAHTIEVQLNLRDDRLNMRITDDAVAFDPRDAKEPDTAAALKDRPVGGLGIYLVKNFMDFVEYRREAGRNQLTLTKNLEKQ